MDRIELVPRASCYVNSYDERFLQDVSRTVAIWLCNIGESASMFVVVTDQVKRKDWPHPNMVAHVSLHIWLVRSFHLIRCDIPVTCV